ncbi:MAG TPA: porin family protein [Salinimicrobium sp.]|nr:porin family protein [Salinimicrobium sp.]
MKKSVLVIAMLFMGTTFMTAQEYIMFGAKGGVNFSNFAGDGFASFDEDSNARTAYHLGLVAEIPLSERFSIQPEVLYSAQGFDIVQIENGNDIEFQLDYITIPVMAKLYIVEGLNIHAGPQFGFLVNSEIDYQPTNDAGDVPLDDENLNNFDMSLGLGAGYKFQSFFVYGRYNAGLTDIYESPGATQGSELKNSVIQVGVGFMF